MNIEELGVSIVIPVYNREKYIQEAIDSLLNQNYQAPIEIIISDDGSTDRTFEIVESYQDSRIKLLRKPADCKSQGASGARNRGIVACTQPYLCFLDSDDFQLDGFLNKMVNILSNSKDIDFLFCRTIEQIEDGDKITQIPWTKKRIFAIDIKYLGFTGSGIVNTNCFLFRKKIFDKTGLFDENFSNAEDADMWMRIGENFKGDFVDFNGSVRRTHGEGQLTKNKSESIRQCILDMTKNALARNILRNDGFRIYKLQNMILSNNKLSLGKRIEEQFWLAVNHPIGFGKHLYIKLIRLFD